MKIIVMFLLAGLLLMVSNAFSNDKVTEGNAEAAEAKGASAAFDINKANCNLPMKEIRKRLPSREAQKSALQRCMKKATEERWGTKALLAEEVPAT